MIAAAVLVLAAEAGFVPLFNGTDLTGWKPAVKAGAESPFSVKDGAVVVNGKGGKLVSAGAYGDFELRLEFRFVVKPSDSGVFFRMPPGGGYQVQTKPYASVKGLGEVRGSKTPVTDLRHDVDAVRRVMRPVGEWQSYAITARGTRAEVRLNGALVCTADGLNPAAGPVGLQAEYGHLEYRNIRIRPVPPETKP